MCEINPAHTLIFRLEAFTSDRSMTAAEFEREVMERVLKAEMNLNADGKFRFHVHEQPKHTGNRPHPDDDTRCDGPDCPVCWPPREDYLKLEMRPR